MNKLKYSELNKLQNFNERYLYVKLNGVVGDETFGFDRYLNQQLYSSPEWKKIRRYVIIRDDGCDLGIPGKHIHGTIYVHHLNPITKHDILYNIDYVLDPEYLICVSKETHDAIHYGTESFIDNEYIERVPGDTKLW